MGSRQLIIKVYQQKRSLAQPKRPAAETVLSLSRVFMTNLFLADAFSTLGLESHVMHDVGQFVTVEALRNDPQQVLC